MAVSNKAVAAAPQPIAQPAAKPTRRVELVNRGGRVHYNGITYSGGAVYEHEESYADHLLTLVHRDIPLFKVWAPKPARPVVRTEDGQKVINLSRTNGVAITRAQAVLPPPNNAVVKVDLGEDDEDPELKAQLEAADAEANGEDDADGQEV